MPTNLERIPIGTTMRMKPKDGDKGFRFLGASDTETQVPAIAHGVPVKYCLPLFQKHKWQVVKFVPLY